METDGKLVKIPSDISGGILDTDKMHLNFQIPIAKEGKLWYNNIKILQIHPFL